MEMRMEKNGLNQDRIEVEEVELEEFAKKNHGHPAPKARRYVIRVDKVKYTVHSHSMTGQQILELAGKTPASDYKLTQMLHSGAAETIKLDACVDFTAPGIERFMTMKLDQVDG
jgi:hypothetical protein